MISENTDTRYNVKLIVNGETQNDYNFTVKDITAIKRFIDEKEVEDDKW